jgi:hypothetical protein
VSRNYLLMRLKLRSVCERLGGVGSASSLWRDQAIGLRPGVESRRHPRIRYIKTVSGCGNGRETFAGGVGGRRSEGRMTNDE